MLSKFSGDPIGILYILHLFAKITANLPRHHHIIQPRRVKQKYAPFGAH